MRNKGFGLIGVLIVIGIIVVGGGSYYLLKSNNIKINNISNPAENEKESTPLSNLSGSNIEKIDDLWNQYINYDLGFKIKYPRKNMNNNVEIIEDGVVTYISQGDHISEINQKKQDSIFDKAKAIKFAILIQEVKNDEELEDFIKKRYANKCLLGDKKKTTKDNTFDITIDTSNWNQDMKDPEGCSMNYSTVIKYNPIVGKVATWDIGQDYNFIMNNKIIDKEISNSFEFIQNN